MLCLHWRPFRITASAAAALCDVLDGHPGPDRVEIVVYDTRLRLPQHVDTGSSGLLAEVEWAAPDALVHIIDPSVPSFDRLTAPARIVPEVPDWNRPVTTGRPL